jgi:hypothetical protein
MTTDQIDPFKTPEDVKQWCHTVTKAGECPTSIWPSNLFGFGKEGYDHTIDYLMQRFRKTENMQEYYCCIPYLYKDITAEELFVPWHLSPNCARLQESNTNIATKNEAVNTGAKVGIKYPESNAKLSHPDSNVRRV